MRGIVIHHQHGISRAINGKRTKGRLSVWPIFPLGFGLENTARPVAFVFYEDRHIIAKSASVLIRRGRRYPDVEHWFVLPEEIFDSTPADHLYTSAAF